MKIVLALFKQEPFDADILTNHDLFGVIFCVELFIVAIVSSEDVNDVGFDGKQSAVNNTHVVVLMS
jgi:hypothetical protein